METNVKEIDDDETTILMVYSNLHREKVLPSEKAFAYKMKFDALNHSFNIYIDKNDYYTMVVKLKQVK